MEQAVMWHTFAAAEPAPAVPGFGRLARCCARVTRHCPHARSLASRLSDGRPLQCLVDWVGGWEGGLRSHEQGCHLSGCMHPSCPCLAGRRIPPPPPCSPCSSGSCYGGALLSCAISATATVFSKSASQQKRKVTAVENQVAQERASSRSAQRSSRRALKIHTQCLPELSQPAMQFDPISAKPLFRACPALHSTLRLRSI